MRTILLAALAAVGLVGCVGGISSEGGDPLDSPDGDGNDNGDNPAGSDLSAAKMLYDTKVYGIVNAKCTGGACHSENATGTTLTRFVATDATKGWQLATNYAALVGNYAASAAPILTKIKAGHKTVVQYTPTEEANITAWLNKEVELRNGQTTPPPMGAETLSQATERVLSEFAGCMSKTNFDAANMAGAWGNMNSGQGQCRTCHINGGFGMLISDVSTDFYNGLSVKKYYFLQYLTVDLTMGTAAAKVIVNTTSFKGVSAGLDPHREHPTFNATTNAGMTALNAFYTSTMARKTAGTCDPPRALQN